jgi:hypothetical protein
VHSSKDNRHPASRSEGILVPFVLFSSLLLAVLIADVVWRMPPRTPEQEQRLVFLDVCAGNLISVKKEVTKLMPSPPTRWASISYGMLGRRGIWYAAGYVGIQSADGEETPILWKGIFAPASAQPLYLAVGAREEGDLEAALRQAGVKPNQP